MVPQRSPVEAQGQITMKKTLRSRLAFLLVASAALLAGPALTPSCRGGHSPGHDGAEDSLFIRTHYRKQEVRIPMRDGAKLFTSLYIPRDTSVLYPVILVRTPYSVGPYGEEEYRTGMFPSRLEAH